MPKPRPFRLETLLRIRKRQEDLRAMNVASALRDVRVAEQQRTQLAEEQRSALARWTDRLQHDLDAGDARRYHQYERHLAHLVDDRDADIRRLEGVAVARRIELIEATKKKRIAEKLRERRNAAYAMELLRHAQRVSDETGTNHAAMARQQETLAPDVPKSRE